MKYNRILIIGAIGSGKTTLANRISKILNIKHHELDNIRYKRRDIHKKREPKIRDKKIKLILKRKKWIIEGFHQRSWAYLIYRKADIVIILNIRPLTSKIRIIRRFLKRKLSLKKNRGVNKKFKTMLKLLRYVEEYPKKYFKMQKKAAKKLNNNVVILKNKKEIEDFLKKIK